MSARLRVSIVEDGREIGVFEVRDANVLMRREIEEIRFDPALAAALAGAPPDVVAGLPGESREFVVTDAHVIIEGTFERWIEA